MGPLQPTPAEVAMQDSASAALLLANEHRGDRREYNLWMRAAIAANNRTRESMIDRGVQMYTHRDNRSVNQ